MAAAMKICAYCGGAAEGNYAIHRDGFDVGPEVELCDLHGESPRPTCATIWMEIAALSDDEKNRRGLS
jgi:hypothetical protein